jgi:hypothetical protein
MKRPLGYEPDCTCVACVNFTKQIQRDVAEGGIAIVGLDFVDIGEGVTAERIDPRTLRRLAESKVAPVGTNAMSEGGAFPSDGASFTIRADELGSSRKLREYTSAERNEIPLHTVLAEYFPDAFAALARHAKKANVKHNGPDAPMAWSREKSTDHLNKAVRHLTTPDAVDPDTGEIELVGALWRCAAALQLREEKRLVSEGIRPLSGIVPEKTGEKPVCPPAEPENPWRVWNTSWRLKPVGRVEVQFRSGFYRTGDASNFNWGELGNATITGWRPLWEGKRAA